MRRAAIFATLTLLLLAVAGVTAAREGTFGGAQQTGNATKATTPDRESAGSEAAEASEKSTPEKRFADETVAIGKSMKNEARSFDGLEDDHPTEAEDQAEASEDGAPAGKAKGKDKARAPGSPGWGGGMYVFHGTVTAVDGGSLTVDVEQGNKFAQAYIGSRVTFALTEETMFVGAGQPAAGARVMVQSSGEDESFDARIVSVKGGRDKPEGAGKAKAAEGKDKAAEGKAKGKGKAAEGKAKGKGKAE